jgi:hypothetical protein
VPITIFKEKKYYPFLTCSDTIGKIQQNTEFYWRYQRYSYVREYFQRPILSYPPLIIVPHIILLGYTIKHKLCSKLSKNQVNDDNSVSKLNSWTPIFSKCDSVSFCEIYLQIAI